MNDIYWHDKRVMSSKQFSSPPPTQPRRSYENTLQTKHYQPVDIRLNSQPLAPRTVTSSYLQYPTVSNQSHINHGNFPYVSSLYGVYRQSPPPTITSPSSSHANQHKHIDLRNNSQNFQQRQLSRSVSEDYYTTRYRDLNGRNNGIYDEENEDDDEENCSEIFNYTFDDTGVS